MGLFPPPQQVRFGNAASGWADHACLPYAAQGLGQAREGSHRRSQDRPGHGISGGEIVIRSRKRRLIFDSVSAGRYL